ncbi:hypothetical protein AB1K70_21485 [Bremerella sp. JC770]|uniref:hypothetical protein n=1 Tax=Bremerella sp. JC770 TaxID=3232137 RepID=UPI003459F384
MSIDFPCSSCQKTVRVPDGTEGKKTKCPQCQQVQVIPDKNSFGTTPTPTPPPPEQPGKSESVWDGSGAETTQPTPPAANNPFGDAPDPFGPPVDNPYSSPVGSSAYMNRPVSRDEARSKLMGPAIGVLLCNGLGLILLLIWAAATIVEIQSGGDINDTAEMVGAGIAIFIMFGLPFLTSLICVAAMIRAFYVRNYALVMTGFILSLTPFGGACGCFIGLFFGIWGIVMMNDDSVKAAFRQP